MRAQFCKMYKNAFIYFLFFLGGGGQDFDRMLEKVLKCLKNKSKSIRVTISIGMRFHGFDKV